MPSSDHEYSSESNLGYSVPLDYAPDTCHDPDFDGLAVGCGVLCREHKLEPNKCVAFGETSTGRRFYVCSVKNQVENCGFVDWVDGEYPATAKRAIGKLWGMYEEACVALGEEKMNNAIAMKNLSDEKNKWENLYNEGTADVNRFIHQTTTATMKANYEKIQKEAAEKDMMHQMKLKISLLESQVSELKGVQRTQAEVMKIKQQKWDEEKEVLKAEKKAVQRNQAEVMQAWSANKGKLARIRAICNE